MDDYKNHKFLNPDMDAAFKALDEALERRRQYEEAKANGTLEEWKRENAPAPNVWKYQIGKV